MIRLEGVCFGYQEDEPILDGLDLELGPGLSLVVGPNGCGKSTLLKVAAGVEKPWDGTVTVGGHDLWREEVTARRQSAYVPEHPDLTPYATVQDILGLVCALRGEPVDAAARELRWVGLEQLGGRTVRELSKGQRRRAVVAAARIGSPGCLILDEPLEGMDRTFRRALLDWIGARRADGATVVLVSHEIEHLVTLADRAVTVVGGRCRVVDTLPAERVRRLEVLDRLARGDDVER